MSPRLEIDSDEVRTRAVPGAARRRRPLRATLLVIAVLAAAGGAWWAYHADRPPLSPAAVPVIHSDAAPVKEAPQDRGGMVVPDQDSMLLNHDGKNDPRVEQLLPAAEPVLPRPAAPENPVPPQMVAPAPPPQVAAPTPPVAPQVTAPSTPAQPAAPSPPVATPAANPSPQVAAGGGYRLQLGALRTEDAAQQEWQRLQRAQPDLLGKLTLTTARVDLGDKGIFYRIQAGPIADPVEAAQSCTALKSRNVGCILVKP
jgi:cell division septation protein DedD